MFYFTKKRFYDFGRENKWFIAFSTLLVAICYGIKIAYQTISLDMEIMIDEPSRIYEQWIAVRRWGMILYKWITGTMSFNMPMETVLLLVNLLLAAVAFAFLLDTLTEGKCRVGLYVFTVLFLTHPVWGEQYIYMVQAAGNSFALFLSAITMMLIIDGLRGRNPWRIIAALISGAICLGTYQSYDYLMLALLLAVYMLLMQENRLKWKARLRMTVEYIVYYVVIRLVSWVVGNCFMNDIGDSAYANYQQAQGNWGKESLWDCWSTIGKSLGRILSGGACYNVVFIVAVVAAIAAFCITAKKYKGWPFMLAALLLMIGTPFVRLFATATEQSVRSNLALTFVAAFLCFYVLSEVALNWLMWMLCIPAFYMGVRQIESVQRIQYTEQVRYTQDVALAEDIMDQISELQMGNIEDIPLVFVGSYKAPLNDACVKSRHITIAGKSIFELYDDNRANAFLRDLGYKVGDCTEEQKSMAVELVNSIPATSFTSDGYVTYVSGMIVVNLDRMPSVREATQIVEETPEDHATLLLGGE